MKLQFLSSTENFLTKSHNFKYSVFNGDGIPSYFHILKENFSHIGVDVVSTSFQEIDKSKPWLVDAILQGWNFYNFRGDILDEFDPKIRKELLEGSAYLLINHEAESHTDLFFENLYARLKDTKLSPSKIIYLCNAYEVDKHYENFVKRKNIEKKDKIFTIFSPHVFHNINEGDIKLFTFDRNVSKSKVYLFLNRIDRYHRVLMVSMLAYYDLLRFGHVSLGTTPDKFYSELYKDDRLIEGYNKIRNSLPLVVDTPDFVTNHVGYSSLPIQFYQQTYFSLVSSTYAFDEQEPSVATNEKEMKPMLAKQPFIIFGKTKTLEYMRSMGFMTFSKWFDESYDTETDDIKRMELICNEIRRLSDLTADQWARMLAEMEPVLLHNYNRLVNHVSERCYFSSDLKKFLFFVVDT